MGSKVLEDRPVIRNKLGFRALAEEEAWIVGYSDTFITC